MADEIPNTLPYLLAASGTGGAGRVILALHGGERSWKALVLEAVLGMLLGLVAASVALYWDPNLQTAGFGLFIVAGVSGFAGALGVRILDMFTEALKKRLGL